MEMEMKMKMKMWSKPFESSTASERRPSRAALLRAMLMSAELEFLMEALATAFNRPGPLLVHLRIASGSRPGLGWPTLGPLEVALRFKAFLGG